MTERVGQQLGNYHIERLLGQGGFADVYLGEHVYLKSQAAIKVLHARLAKEDIADFLSEARTLVHLIHPHIVRVLDFGLENDTPFLVMDYAPNGTLRQRHPKGSQAPLASVVDYVKQVADALQYAHNIKVIHCDVKPENMLIGRNNEILLSDFGIAIVAQSSRYSIVQEMAGTIAYMAPEQIQSHPRPASDQYALAITVYEWLSGQRPFSGSFTEIAAKHAITPPPPLRALVPTIPPSVEQVLQMALEKDPTKRFANIRAFAATLEEASKDAQFSSSGLETTVSPSSSGSLSTLVQSSPDEASLPTALATPPHQRVQFSELTTPAIPSSQTPLPAVQPHRVSAQSLRSIESTSRTEPFSQPPVRTKRSFAGIIIGILVVLLVISSFITFFTLSQRNSSTNGNTGAATTVTTLATATTAPSPTAIPSPTPTQISYPNMAGFYQGNIHNTYANMSSTMTLTVDQQPQGGISGQFTVALPLQGTGPFTGNIDTQGNFRFLVTSSDTTAPILFSGNIQPDGSLSGSYCSVNSNNQCDTSAGGHGVWDAAKS